MWKNKRSSSRRYGKKKIPASAIPRSIARVRKQRIVTFNTMQACEYTCLPPEQVNCTEVFTLALLRNTDLQSLFGDNVKVVSMQGNVFFDPLWTLPYSVDSNCVSGILGDPASWLAFFNATSRTVWQLRAGLIKTLSATTSPASPVPDYDVSQSFDWSEPAFMRRWNHMWFMREELGLDVEMQGAVRGICANVSKPDTGALVNALAAGTGNINTQTGAITTDCQTFLVGGNNGSPQRGYRTLRHPTPYRMSVNSKRVISLQENENLEIQGAFSTLFPGADCFPTETDTCFLDCSGLLPCTIRIIPNILMTLQYG